MYSDHRGRTPEVCALFEQALAAHPQAAEPRFEPVVLGALAILVPGSWMLFADRAVLMDSATQAIELLCRFLLKPGDTVLVDDPCFFNFLAKLRAHRVDILGVPMTPGGPDVAALADILSAHRPRLYLTNSALHNPTGASLSPLVAHRVSRSPARFPRARRQRQRAPAGGSR